MFLKIILVLQLMQSLFAIEHCFIQRIKSDGTITKKINGMLVKECVKKVYIDLILEGQYIFRRKAILGNKVRFCCKPCERNTETRIFHGH